MTKSFNMKYQRNQPRCLLLKEFSLLFYLGKLMGITSFDYQEFRKYNRLKRSPGGDFFVIISLIIVFVNFNLMVGIFENTLFLQEKNLLAVVIGFVLTYFSLFAHMVDRIVAMRKQDQLVQIFEDLQDLEDDFNELELKVNNEFIKRRITFALLFAVILESVIFGLTFVFLVDRSSWTSWLWLFTAAPTFANSLDKMWFLAIVMVINHHFKRINNELQRLATNLECQKKKNAGNFTLSTLKGIMLTLSMGSKATVYPQQQIKGNKRCGTTFDSRQQQMGSAASVEVAPAEFQTPSSMTFDKIEDRLTRLCQLHDGLCGVANATNDVWAIPNLVGMGYCFFIIIAQLYFLYCSRSAQLIPALFRPTSSFIITILFVGYTGTKCVRVLYVNWITSLQAKKTGICIHRYALAADKNEIYEMINHLSLKLFNHSINFNACGYFSLDMATLFAFCGGITTYLIILIQFNIEEHQVKSTSNGSVQEILSGTNVSAAAALQKNVTSIFYHMYYNFNGGKIF